MPTAALGPGQLPQHRQLRPWLAAFKKEALAKGISQAALAAASPYLVLEQRIINIDRGQKFFAQNFLEISDKMLPGGRLPAAPPRSSSTGPCSSARRRNSAFRPR